MSEKSCLENKIIEKHDDNDIPLSKLKIGELKSIIRLFKKKIADNINNYPLRSQQKFYKKISSKIHDFGLMGTKKVLIDRVQQIYDQEEKAVLIQKNVRRLFVKQVFMLRGPGSKNRKLCINESDFCTLEPVENIDIVDFFSCKSQNSEFVYGFDLNSLIHFYKRKNRLLNPYTREPMNEYIPSIQKIYRLNKILFKTNKNQEEDGDIFTRNNFLETQNIRRRLNSIELPNNYDASEITIKLRNLREQTVMHRVENLFMDIDSHGHYTNKDWFIQLNYGDMMRLFRILRDIWNYRSRLPFLLKLRICPLWDPFIGITFNYRDIIYSQIQNFCLTAMEDITYMGIDDTHRGLGVFQVLTALTFVSNDARRTMPWLYESIF